MKSLTDKPFHLNNIRIIPKGVIINSFDNKNILWMNGNDTIVENAIVTKYSSPYYTLLECTRKESNGDNRKYYTLIDRHLGIIERDADFAACFTDEIVIVGWALKKGAWIYNLKKRTAIHEFMGCTIISMDFKVPDDTDFTTVKVYSGVVSTHKIYSNGEVSWS